MGEKFIPGSDQGHFCKPTGVAVTVDGSIYVADGYCNNRIMKFDRNGKFVMQWGHPNYGSRFPLSKNGVGSKIVT